jgi:hypothetical protein
MELAVGVSDPHRRLVICTSDRQFVVFGTAEVAKSETSIRIAALTPRLRILTELAVAIHPDLEACRYFVGHWASTKKNPRPELDIP